MFPLPDSYADSYSDYAEMLHWDQFQWSFRCKVTMKITLKTPPYQYQYQCQIGYSTHLHQNRFSGNSSAHYYIITPAI